MHHPRTWLGRTAGCVLAAALIMGACGDDDQDADPPSGEAVPPALESADPDRCEANRDAGPITFSTGFDFGAAVSILDVVAAADQGYYADLCLDVRVQPGFSLSNIGLLSAGQVQFAGVGSFSEVAVANAAGADITAVIVYGKTSIETLLIEDDSAITELSDLTTAPMGVKGGIPYAVRAMIAEAGVDEDDIVQIEVDFNPVLLFETEIESLPGYKSNEPRQLEEQGYSFRQFDPADYDVPATFGAIAVNPSFAAEHPTAAEDFVRATLRGFWFGVEDPDAAVDASLAQSDPDLFFSPESEMFRWTTERDLVLETTPDGQPVGAMTLDRLEAEVANLERLGVLDPGEVDVAGSFDNGYVERVHDGTDLVWPGD
ncbi:MAG: ABC transporter substrate-binding protein [Acidimicrobiales bacterium]